MVRHAHHSDGTGEPGGPAPHPAPSGPGVALLDALRGSDWEAAQRLLAVNVEFSAPQTSVTAHGPNQCRELLRHAISLFPDLGYQPHTRRVGAGIVVDEGFVIGTQTGGPSPTGQRMTATMRLTASHDDTTVHKLSLHVGRAAVDRALGRAVDPMVALYADFQALRADMHTGMTVHQLQPLTMPPQNDPPGPATSPDTKPPHARRTRVVIAAVATLLAGAGAAVYLSRSTTSDHTIEQPNAPGTSASASPRPSSTPPSLTPSISPTPTIVLSADLAFASNSAAVSPQARAEILRLAARARGLSGTILVDGYTDNVGSAASGRVLSQQRADAVAAILRSALGRGSDLRVTATGHGEADPAAPNTTAAGRAKNRRVTITLPQRGP